MKALSIRQPWADLIVDGRKTIETRKWNTGYRGWFWVHASRSVDWNACKRLGITPSAAGTVIGKAFLESVKRYETEEEWDADRSRHLALGGMPRKPMYGFVISRAERVPAVPARGKLGFWEWEIGREN